MHPDELPPVLQTVIARVVKAERRRAQKRAEDARREVYASLGEVLVKSLPSMLLKAAAHAPAGGVKVQGTDYKGGQFIPAEVMERATAEEKAAVEGEAVEVPELTYRDVHQGQHGRAVKSGFKSKNDAEAYARSLGDGHAVAPEANRENADWSVFKVKGKGTAWERPKERPREQPANPPPAQASAGRRTAATEMLDAAIDSTHGLTDAQKAQYKEAAREATKMMPPKAVAAIREQVKAVSIHPNLESLRYRIAQDVADMTASGDPKWLQWLDNKLTGGEVARRKQAEIAAEIEKQMNDAQAAGAWIHANGNVYLDGGGMTGGANTAGIYAHELTHAIDAGRIHSDSPAWQEAFTSEIDRPGSPLSEYARTSPSESFAEFGRAVYTSDTRKRRELERQFPKATAYFKENGLWPS